MAAWPERLEHFLGQYPHLIAGLEAISTFAAVVVSLSLASAARRANNTRLRARVQKSVLVSESLGPQRPTYVTVNITNTGILPLRIPLSFFVLKVPFKRTNWLMMVLDSFGTDRLIPQKRYPVEIAPRANGSFYVGEVATFRKSFQEMVMSTNGVTRFLFRFARVLVVSDDGLRFKATIDENVRQELKQLAKGRTISTTT